jgi:catechol 2,3-dioxygenase-like lactoylglutathione lyase family enzyme
MAAKKASKGKSAAKKSKSKSAAKAPARKPAKKPAAKSAAAKKDDGSLRLTSAGPSFTVNDIEKSLAWYRDILGFKVGERWEMDGVLRGVELNAGNVLFMIAQDDWKKGRDRVKGEGVRMYCGTNQNIDQLAARIKAAGGTLAQEPTDQPWGTRDLAVEDPDGYKITIGNE